MMVWAVSLSTMKLIPHCLTPILSTTGIQSLIDFGRLVGPLDHSVLYHRWKTDEANPQTISGRTSYIRVRLAFTTTHSSSKAFSTATGSALHEVLPSLQPVHG